MNLTILAYDLDGTFPAIEFLEALDAEDQRKMRALFRYLAETGLSNKEKFKKIRKDVWGLKSYQIRMAAFYGPARKTLVVSHGFVKKDNRWPEKEIKKAQRNRDDMFDRAKKSK